MSTTISETQFWVEVPLYWSGGGSEPYTVEPEPPIGLDVFSTDELVLLNIILRRANSF